MSDYQTPSIGGHVLWINGAFGAGKTTTANLLTQSIPGSVLLDTEEIGSLLRPVLQPVAPVLDFQEWSAWRVLVATTLNAVVDELPTTGPRLVIVPQTITNQVYWSQIKAGLRPEIDVVTVALRVTQQEHLRRAREDVEEPDALRWRLNRFDDFHAAEWLHTEFSTIETTALPPVAVAHTIERLIARVCSI